MADRAFTTLVTRIQPSVPGCPQPTIIQYIREAAIRTCEKTLAWRYQPALFNLTASVSEYAYSKPANTDVHVMFDAVVNKRPLERLTMEKAIELYPQWTAADSASTPQSITQLTPDQYIILPLPDALATYQVRMFLALKPKRNATGMEEIVFDELEDAITHGALQQLLVLPDVQWSDRELAVYHAKQFTYQCAERRARANLSNMRGTVRAKMQPFGA